MKHYDNVVRLPRGETSDPIAALEIIAEENKWPLEKHADDEASFDCIGRWGELTMNFLWQDEYQSLQLCCMSDLSVNDATRDAVKTMLYEVNRKTWAGYFTLDDAEDYVVFRYTSLMRHMSGDVQEHIEDMLEVTLAEMDRFYPAFQAAINGNGAPSNMVSSPANDMHNNMLVALLAEPMGEA